MYCVRRHDRHTGEDRKILCNLLKQLVWAYVIDRPALATQQHGQARIIHDLVLWYHDARDLDLERMLPHDRMAELEEHGDKTRAIADHVASLTQPMAMKLYGKCSGN